MNVELLLSHAVDYPVIFAQSLTDAVVNSLMSKHG